MTARNGKRIVIVTGGIAAIVIAVTTWLGWPHIRFLYFFAPLGRNAQGYPEHRHRQTGIVFVALPGGMFNMGAQKTDPDGPNYDPEAEDDEGPVLTVVLSPFLIAKNEVTQAQWKAVMGENPSHLKGDDDRPMENVSWDDIQTFGAKTGLRLPTEAQWEYACRAGTTTPFVGMLDDMGWYKENSSGTTHPVGKKAPNGFGLHDVHGNVWEWCEDVYDDGFYMKPEARVTDPCSDMGSDDRAIRGGGYGHDAGGCRSSYRVSDLPSELDKDLGFRPVWPPSGASR
jgi:formylglycine-generating enzyme required for sulfatase activity